MLRVALTGGIATGKSYVRERLSLKGVPTIDADTLAREAVATGTSGLAAVVERFGRSILTPDGGLDRAALGRVVFEDPAARRDLEAIVHPRVYAAISGWLDMMAADPRVTFAVADVPLLFETGHAGGFDVVVVVTCSPETQRARLRARDGLTESEAGQRLAAQWPVAEKVRLADLVIETTGSFVETNTQIDAVYAQLCERAQRE